MRKIFLNNFCLTRGKVPRGMTHSVLHGLSVGNSEMVEELLGSGGVLFDCADQRYIRLSIDINAVFPQ